RWRARCRGGGERPHSNHGGLRLQSQESAAVLLEDLDVSLLLAHTKLGERSLDGLLNAFGAFFDFRHCGSSLPLGRTSAASAVVGPPALMNRAHFLRLGAAA